MFRNSQKYLCGDCLTTSYRTIILTSCRYKSANINSRNYYELLGVERTATQKDIKKAFFKLSKEYHPDSNSADKSLHDKFVKINEAFGILSKQSTRTTYDQSLNSVSRPSYTRPTDWSNINYGSRPSYQRPESNWGAPHYDKTLHEMFRRKMEHDRQRSNTYSYYYSPAHDFQNTYFAPLSIILMLIGFGMFIHALQWRIMKFSDPQYAVNPRTRHYHAYREWQRLSELRDAEYMPIRPESSDGEEE